MHNAYTIGEPLSSQRNGLRLLWKEAFGDDDSFLDMFASTAFSASRCRCVTKDDTVIASLYWFDCTFQGEKIAYIYAVATAKNFRGQGLCHALMEDTHKHLAKLGYAAVLLAPATDALFSFYKSLGYKTATYVDEISIPADTLVSLDKTDILVHSLKANEFLKIRNKLLPKGSVLQENENLDFLAAQAQFFAGKDFLLTARIEGTHLHGIEFLGDTTLLPEIVHILHCKSACIRTLGKDKAFTMYFPFKNNFVVPKYFGFIFD